MSRHDATFALAHRGPAIDGVAQPYRRREAPRRSRPRLASVLFSGVGKPLLAIALPVGLLIWMLTSPLFALASVEVQAEGTRVSSSWIEQRLAPLAGANVLRISLADVESRLTGHPWIEGVEIVKRLPSSLTVIVSERTAAALVLDDETLWYSDPEGRLVEPLPAGEASPAADGTELILVVDAQVVNEEGWHRAAAVPTVLEVVRELDAAQPAWAAGLTQARPLSDEDFELETAALPFPVRVQKGRIAERAARLAELLGEIERRYERLVAVDLRFERRIVLKPWPPRGGSERNLEGTAHGQAG